ncbi:MAG: RHS repeat-associated core domain-containing protein [Pseudomonas shirazensis]
MTKTNAGDRLYFHQGDKLATVKQGTQNHSVFRSLDTALAEQLNCDSEPVRFLTTDGNGSVLQVKTDQQLESLPYTAYGHSASQPSTLSLLGFNGECIDPAELYILGNGYRSHNPRLMRFLSPDSLSPFGKGGLNSYAYCGADPVNFTDPSGHFRLFGRLFAPKLPKHVKNAPTRELPSYSEAQRYAVPGERLPSYDETLRNYPKERDIRITKTAPLLNKLEARVKKYDSYIERQHVKADKANSEYTIYQASANQYVNGSDMWRIYTSKADLAYNKEAYYNTKSRTFTADRDKIIAAIAELRQT